jgi:hypothetical protein
MQAFVSDMIARLYYEFDPCAVVLYSPILGGVEAELYKSP